MPRKLHPLAALLAITLATALTGTSASAATVNFTSGSPLSSSNSLTFASSAPAFVATVYGYTLNSSFTPTPSSILSNTAGLGVGADSNLDPYQVIRISLTQNVRFDSITFTNVDASDSFAAAIAPTNANNPSQISTFTYGPFGAGSSTRTISLTNFFGGGTTGDLYIASYNGAFSLNSISVSTPSNSIPLPTTALAASPLLALSLLRRHR